MPFDYSTLPPVVANSLDESLGEAPYHEALVNCGNGDPHSLSMVTELFGAMQDEACEKSGPWQRCRGRVTANRSNPWPQHLVDVALGAHKMNEAARKCKPEFDSDQVYPVAKTDFVLEASKFEERHAFIRFKKGSCGAGIDDAIKSFSAEILKTRWGVRLGVSLYFHGSQSSSALKFQKFAERNGLNSLEGHGSFLGINSAKRKDVEALMQLVMKFNTFDEGALAALKAMQQRLEALAPDPLPTSLELSFDF